VDAQRGSGARCGPGIADARLRSAPRQNWAEADRLRAELKAAGWEMEDRADGYALKRP
jgi:cysteinyl-tRNA synthetase